MISNPGQHCAVDLLSLDPISADADADVCEPGDLCEEDDTSNDNEGDGTCDDLDESDSDGDKIVVCSASGLAVRSTSLTPASAACPAGGVRIASGIDTDGDYQLGDPEVQSSEGLCGAVSALFSTETFGENAAVCAHGGVRVKDGRDDGKPSGTRAGGILQGRSRVLRGRVFGGHIRAGQRRKQLVRGAAWTRQRRNKAMGRLDAARRGEGARTSPRRRALKTKGREEPNA